MRNLVKALKIDFTGEERQRIAERMENVFSTGMVSNNRYVEELETAFKKKFGFKYAMALSNCTSAIEIGLKVIGVEGKDVFINANTFFSEIVSIERAGGIPVLVDVHQYTSGMDYESLVKAISKSLNPGAIVTTHLGGYMNIQTDKICSLGVPVIEDCAHACGSHINGKFAGRFGLMGAYSFSAIKIVTGGEGGMLVTDDKEVFDKASDYREWGKRGHDQWVDGSNHRLSEWNAIIALGKLERLDDEIATRRKIAEVYKRELSIDVKVEFGANYYRCIGFLPEKNRIEVVSYWMLSKHGVEMPAACYHTPIYKTRYWMNKYGKHEELPGVESFCKRHIVFPCYSALTLRQIDIVVHGMKEVLEIK